MIASDTANMLADCGAVTFAPNDVTAAALGTLASKFGFGTVANYTQFAELPKNRLTYFLVHGQLPDGAKQRIIQGLRSSDCESRLRRTPAFGASDCAQIYPGRRRTKVKPSTRREHQ